jgi:hypothetical protein
MSDTIQSTEPVAYTNAWGDDPRLYSEEFCPECGRLLPGNYTNCSPEGRQQAAQAQLVPLSAVPMSAGTRRKERS